MTRAKIQTQTKHCPAHCEGKPVSWLTIQSDHSDTCNVSDILCKISVSWPSHSTITTKSHQHSTDHNAKSQACGPVTIHCPRTKSPATAQSNSAVLVQSPQHVAQSHSTDHNMKSLVHGPVTLPCPRVQSPRHVAQSNSALPGQSPQLPPRQTPLSQSAKFPSHSVAKLCFCGENVPGLQSSQTHYNTSGPPPFKTRLVCISCLKTHCKAELHPCIT